MRYHLNVLRVSNNVSQQFHSQLSLIFFCTYLVFVMNNMLIRHEINVHKNLYLLVLKSQIWYNISFLIFTEQFFFTLVNSSKQFRSNSLHANKHFEIKIHLLVSETFIWLFTSFFKALLKCLNEMAAFELISLVCAYR